MNEATPAANGQSSDERMRQLILEIVQALVDQPDGVSVELIEDREATILQVRVAPQDIGKVIGKQGRTARSLRTILGAASMKLRHRFALDIIEDEDDEDDLEDGEQPQNS
ncbi:MAG: KH domain-containing protein [Acidobacteriaceae bacterium]